MDRLGTFIGQHVPPRTGGPAEPPADALPSAWRDDAGYAYVDPADLAPAREPGPPPRVPARYHARLADLTPSPAVTAARTWLDGYRRAPDAARGLLLIGPVGTGKSTIAGALAVEAGAPGDAHFWPTSALLRTIRDEMHTPHADRMGVVDRIATRRLLVLDDLGAERASEWSRQDVIAGLISARYDARQPIVITSNLTPAAIVAHLDDPRLGSRLTEMADIIEVGGQDRRRAGGRR